MMQPAETILVHQTAEGNRQAYGQLVERHQSLVCSVAYSIVGDFARSEDVAQEAFLTAWTRVSELREPAKFVPWICGIARNLALMVVRREQSFKPVKTALSTISPEPSPPDQAVAREEERIVWHALEALPESYREPLILFYREQNTVARVAEALELSEDAVKQRLSRGREMLRNEMATVIERTLRRTAPKAAFVLTVMGALPGIGAATASAATAITTGKAAGSIAVTSSANLAAPMLGGGLGILGALLGIWASDQSTRYPRERALLRKGVLIWFVAFVLIVPVPILVVVVSGWSPMAALGAVRFSLLLAAWVFVPQIASFLWFWRITRSMQRSVAEDLASGATPLPQTRLQQVLAHREERIWTSRWKLLGLPLIGVYFSGTSESKPDSPLNRNRPFAKGWIAIGDRACGVIAFGGVAVGGIALGGICIGGVAMGGVGLGIVSFCGLCAGLLSIGGLALGWIAAGGLAVGWFAFGGGAFAWRAAKGGCAIAHDFAIGGAAQALHSNDAAAKAYFAESRIFQIIEPAMMKFAEFVKAHPTGWIFICIAIPIGLNLLLNCRRRTGNGS